MSKVWLNKVEISLLWGSRNITIPIDLDVVIIHGANGTGKTTIMNLIASVLSVSVKHLNAIEFKSLKLTFLEIDSSRKPIIEVIKDVSSSGEIKLTYVIKEKTSSTGTIFTIQSIPSHRREYISYDHGTDQLYYPVLRIKEYISQFVSFSWLTVDRGTFSKRSVMSSVDQKLSVLLEDFKMYCAQLNRQELTLKEEFQKSVFLSFLSSKKESIFREGLEKIDFDKEKSSLIEIYNHFSVSKSSYMNKISGYFKRAEDAVKGFVEKKSFKIDQLITFFDVVRIHSMIEEWNDQRDKIANIYRQKELFFKIINGMLHYKKLLSEDDFNLVAITNSDKELTVQDLSSGEKQLLILLCESLLQRETPWIYLADEPELSLHVEWQEKLIDCIKTINPKAQIFFATHSPDIVGEYSNNTLDLERLLDVTN